VGRRAIAKESERHMSTQLDFKSIPGMTKEVREELAATFDALSNWRDEIETANERSLGKVLDRTAAVARAMGWPDQAVRSTREYLEGASKAQTEMIDQVIEGWKRQLTSSGLQWLFRAAFRSRCQGWPQPILVQNQNSIHLRPGRSGCRRPRCGNARGYRRRPIGRTIVRIESRFWRPVDHEAIC